MSDYQAILRQHLGRYASTRLGVTQPGEFRGRTYDHILPKERDSLNLLESCRDGVMSHLKSHPKIKLHQYFHHLNSSQAFAFNLFFPYFNAGGMAACALGALLGVDDDIDAWEFESIPDPEEGTNVDVSWRTRSGQTVNCEVKLCEAEFGNAKNDERHRDKLDRIYRSRLQPLVSGDMLEENTFLAHYQLLRNVALLAANDRDQVVFLLPRENKSLRPQLLRVLGSVSDAARQRIHVAYIEDVLRELTNHPALSHGLRQHAASMIEKYIPK